MNSRNRPLCFIKSVVHAYSEHLLNIPMDNLIMADFVILIYTWKSISNINMFVNVVYLLSYSCMRSKPPYILGPWQISMYFFFCHLTLVFYYVDLSLTDDHCIYIYTRYSDTNPSKNIGMLS